MKSIEQIVVDNRAVARRRIAEASADVPALVAGARRDWAKAIRDEMGEP